MWVSLQEGRREQEFRKIPKWKKYWRLIQKKDAAVPDKEKLDWERKFLHKLMLKFIDLLQKISPEGNFDYVVTESLITCVIILQG